MAKGRELFGFTVRDLISGFQGVVTGYTTYITGCDSYLVQPPVGSDGKSVDPKWVDEARLQVMPAFTPIKLPGQQEPSTDKESPRGGDIAAPIR